ncbi:purine-binding chemotaxis protein CheW [Sporomusaceae bacterium BoRhaA]|uniref:chemotaxis protein CheW n=1 Tax=Pelorhabdus rhamnosifermentans TaxID=2772457 RepID=UPI001C061CF9|nr:chemotaxis protein CheW [Pelorhabdus rhamnosifermentans]MBU2701800.1 purine-binding chemotaxis protein CheW [Pelorhabdus rhamnosifermentans]
MTGKILTFQLGANVYGMDIAFAKEINQNVSYTIVPGESDEIVGLLNLRGTVITLFNLAAILQFQSAEMTKRNHCIILRNYADEFNQAGFFIDKLGDVMDITSNMCEEPPAQMKNGQDCYISEVVRCTNQLILVLDIPKIFGAKTNSLPC